jgi:hypothetical protein
MSEQAYNRVANVLMMIGIASAFLFDSGKLPKVVVGAIGIISGLSAMVLYFWNQHQTEAKNKAAERSKVSEAATAALPRTAMMRNPVRETDAMRDWVAAANAVVWRDVAWHNVVSRACETDEIIRRRKANIWIRNYAAHHARTLQWKMPTDAGMMLMRPEVELSPNEVAACAIEIVKNLAVADDLNEWEYDFGPKGLRVSVRKGYRSMRPVSIQEDLNFDQDTVFATSLSESQQFLQD